MKASTVGCLLACALLLGVFCVSSCADEQIAIEREPPKLWFPVGEDLRYRLSWGFIPVGQTRVLSQWIEDDGRLLLVIKIRTRSNKAIATFYPVDDLIEVIIDPETFLPVLFSKNLKEGKHRYHEITRFDYEKGVARWESVLKQKAKEYAITPDLRDIVTLMYYLRSRPLSKELEGEYRAVADEKIYEMKLSVYEKEDVDVSHFGSVPCLKLEPQAKFQGIFVRDKGRMFIWASLRDRPLITRIKVKAPIGTVRALLTEVHGPGDDFWTRQTAKNLKLTPEQIDPEVEKALSELDGQ